MPHLQKNFLENTAANFIMRESEKYYLERDEEREVRYASSWF